MFDLEPAIKDWRRQLANGQITSPEVLDELENHLRDDIEQQMQSGLEAQRAFEFAVLHLGTACALQREFAKSARPSRQRFVRWCCFLSAIFVLLINSWTLIEFELSAGQRIIGFSIVVWAAAYLASLPFLHRLLSKVAYDRLLAAVKLLSLLTPLVPILALLTAGHVIELDLGILPTLVVWLLYAAIGLTAVACTGGADPGWEGGSIGPIPPSSGPIPIPPGQPCPPIFGAPTPSANEFAPGARRSLEVAREEATRLGHDFVGTEHVLLGVLKLAGEGVKTILQKSNVDGETVRWEIEQLVVAQAPRRSPTALPFTPRAQKALELAREEARTRNQPSVNIEHILLGLLLEGKGVAAQVLKNVGIQFGRIREEISRLGTCG